MGRNFHQQVIVYLRDKYPIEYKEIADECKKDMPFRGNTDSYRERTRHSTNIYSEVHRQLKSNHEEEYEKKMLELNPNAYGKRALARWQIIDRGTDFILKKSNNELLKTEDLNLVFKYIKEYYK